MELPFVDAEVIAPEEPPPPGEIWLVVAYRKTGVRTGHWALRRANSFEEFKTRAEAEEHLKRIDSMWRYGRIVRIQLP